ncbi:hypothetical protein PMSD_27470 [Paenibacillus macquariensis subsp. defensor]|nr:hypothetical protein PMSD_27470 [Paenibacillus macquariensis subsp. defensor]
MLTVLSWIAFDAYKTTVVLVFYLVVYIALQLSGSLSVLLTAAVIAGDVVIWLCTQQVDLNEILMYSIIT